MTSQGEEQKVAGIYDWEARDWTILDEMRVPGESYQCHVFGHGHKLMVIGGTKRGTPLHKVR